RGDRGGSARHRSPAAGVHPDRRADRLRRRRPDPQRQRRPVRRRDRGGARRREAGPLDRRARRGGRRRRADPLLDAGAGARAHRHRRGQGWHDPQDRERPRRARAGRPQGPHHRRPARARAAPRDLHPRRRRHRAHPGLRPAPRNTGSKAMTTSPPGGDRQQDLIALAEKKMLRNYRQQPVVFTRGEGVHLWDARGDRYLDMTAGISVCSLGHSHPALTRVIAEQAARVLHTSNLYYNEQQIRAAAAIVDRSFADRVYFGNSGAEANEAALKLARRYAHVVRGEPERNLVVATLDSFHGRTFATMSVTGQEKYRTGFGPLLEPVQLVPFGDLAAAEKALAPGKACAFLVEPIQAEGGIVVPPPGYLAGLREVCDRTGTLLIFDEVQTGVGRTGKLFGHQWEGVTPDVMTLAKALGGGVPIGAMA